MISQNRWVYDNLLKFLPPQRICYWERSIPDLPPAPEKFWLLETREGAPYYKDLSTMEVLFRKYLGKYVY